MEIQSSFRSSYKPFRKHGLALQLLAVLVIVIFCDIAAERFSLIREHDQLRVSTSNALGTLRARLEGEINSNAQLVRGLVAAIALDPGMTNERFTELAEQLFKSKSQLRNLGIAPDMVIRYVYPLEGNEGAIGLDYTKNPAQREAALRVREVGDIVVAGPVNLVQGGQAFVSRIPVFIAKDGNAKGDFWEKGNFWGLISAVIDIDRLYKDTGLLNDDLPIEIAIRGKDALGANGDVFFGEKQLFTLNPVLVNVILPYGSWQMAAIPNGGWPKHAANVNQIRTIFALIAILALTIISFTKRLSDRHKQAEHKAHMSDLRFRDFAESSSDWFWEMDENLKFSYLSERFEKITGWPASAIIGKLRSELVDQKEWEANAPQWQKHFDDLAAHQPFRNFEYTIVPSSNSKPVTIRTSGVPIFDIDGNFTGYRGTGEDITERTLLEKSKSEFISTVSHELRTPLTSIKGSLGLLAGGATEKLKPETAELIRIAHGNAEHLTSLVNDILDFEKLNSGHMKFHFKKCDLADLIRESVEANRGYSQQFDVRFELEEPLAPLTVLADQPRITQVMANLLSNAAKFSPKGDVVHISLHQDGNMARVAVSDNGPGIPEQFFNHIFDRFTQYDGSDQRAHGGTGLGLSICKNIIERHNGEINFDTSLKTGTTFYFSLHISD